MRRGRLALRYRITLASLTPVPASAGEVKSSAAAVLRSETTLASLAVHKAEREEKRYEEIRKKVAKQAPSTYVGQQHVKQTPPPKVGLPIHLRFRRKR